MTAFESLSQLELSLLWHDELREFFGLPCRPLSLASREAIRVMGLRMLDREPELDEAQDLGEMAGYAWLHTAPLSDVCEGLRSGSWRGLEIADPDGTMRPETLPLWRDYRLGLAARVAGVEYDVRARPRVRPAKGGSDPALETPVDVIEPSRLAFRLRLLMRDTGATRVEALWEWPYCQAVAICHAAQRWEGQWTVPSMERTGPADFGGFEMRAEDAGDAGDDTAEEGHRGGENSQDRAPA
jgi:hypothetical protein